MRRGRQSNRKVIQPQSRWAMRTTHLQEIDPWAENWLWEEDGVFRRFLAYFNRPHPNDMCIGTCISCLARWDASERYCPSSWGHECTIASILSLKKVSVCLLLCIPSNLSLAARFISSQVASHYPVQLSLKVYQTAVLGDLPFDFVLALEGLSLSVSDFCPSLVKLATGSLWWEHQPRIGLVP